MMWVRQVHRASTPGIGIECSHSATVCTRTPIPGLGMQEELDRVHQARQAHEDEAARLKAKLSQRSIELMLLEQKVQAADERTEAQAQKAAQQAEATAVAK